MWPCDRRCRALTLVELLVVISIIALLIGILLPALASARRAAHDTGCKSSIRQAAQALAMYATEDSGKRLPPGRSVEGVFWYAALGRYLGHDADVAPGSATGFGASYLRCPAQEQDCYHTYGINYDISRKAPFYMVTIGGDNYVYGRRYDDVDPATYLIGDAHNRDWGYGYSNATAVICNPGDWTLDRDWDGDGFHDTCDYLEHYQGPYNGWGPWHSNTGNFVFSDGHAESVTVNEWITNRNDSGLWHTDRVEP